MSHLISPSILAADFANLESEIKMLNKSKADWIHIDVMDGVFVPNISFGQPVIKAIKKHAKIPLDVHLMIKDADRYIEDFKTAGADMLTVHLEACPHLHRTIQAIKAAGMKAGVALNPHSSVGSLVPIIKELDLVLIMSVNPGFGGQKFIASSIQKVKNLKNLIASAKSNTKIEVDGGVNMNNAAKLLAAGADVLVAGSFVFKSENPTETIAQLKACRKA